MAVMGWLLVIVGLITLLLVWPVGLLFLALGIWMISSGNRNRREEMFQARLLAEMQAQRDQIDRERAEHTNGNTPDHDKRSQWRNR